MLRAPLWLAGRPGGGQGGWGALRAAACLPSCLPAKRRSTAAAAGGNRGDGGDRQRRHHQERIIKFEAAADTRPGTPHQVCAIFSRSHCWMLLGKICTMRKDISPNPTCVCTRMRCEMRREWLACPLVLLERHCPLSLKLRHRRRFYLRQTFQVVLSQQIALLSCSLTDEPPAADHRSPAARETQ